MSTLPMSPTLKVALLADAIVSGAVAAQQLAFTTPLAELTLLPAALLSGTGLFMVGYTALLLALWRAPRVLPWLIRCIVAGNVGWALACLALLAGQVVTFNAWGEALLLVQAAGVLVLAGWEGLGLRRCGQARPGLRAAAA
ncbi:MAG: hypothetical protein IV092_17145 [Burkholderiaceae bacterium]|nr:hypothetical protein [Burkholderiaceae bacterium]